MMKEFMLSELFEVKTTNSIDKNKIIFSPGGECDFIGRSSANNGIQGRMNRLDYEPNPKNTFSLVQVGESVCLFREREWYASQNIFILIPKIEKLCFVPMYIMATVNAYLGALFSEAYTYPKLADVKVIPLSLPVIESSDPDHEYTVDDIDWQYMQDRIAELEQDRIAELEQDRIAELEAYLAATGLDDYELTDEDKQVLSLSAKCAFDKDVAVKTDCQNGQVRFKRFVMHDIFELLTVKKAKKSEVRKCRSDEFCVPVVYAKFGDNGIMYWGRKHEFTTYKNVISIVYNGAIAAGKVYAQADETGILAESYFIRYKNKRVPFLANLYMAKVIEHKIYPLYSRETLAIWNNRVENEEIELPVNSDDEPDFNYMERYIRAMEKLAIADVVKYKDKVIEATKEVVAQ